MSAVQFSATLRDYLEDRIPKAAREANRHFPLVSIKDFEQELWLRACVSFRSWNEVIEQDSGPEFIYRKLRDMCHRYGMQDDRDRRARKAAAAGYVTHDEFFYEPKMVGHLISELIQSEWDLPFAMDRATKGTDLTGVRVQDGDDGHDGFMDYLVLLNDVKAAFGKLSGYRQDMLIAWFSIGSDATKEDEEQGKWEREAIANSMGLTYDALRMRKNRALSVLIRELGGESPYIRRRRGENETANA